MKTLVIVHRYFPPFFIFLADHRERERERRERENGVVHDSGGDKAVAAFEAEGEPLGSKKLFEEARRTGRC